jgi:hypothetical protein
MFTLCMAEAWRLNLGHRGAWAELELVIVAVIRGTKYQQAMLLQMHAACVSICRWQEQQ